MKSYFRNLSAIAIVVVVLSIVVLCYSEHRQREVLATAVDGFIGPLVPTLVPMPALNTDIPIGKNAVWWIGEGIEYAGGGIRRSTGAMRSAWSGGYTPPNFSELDSILVVKGTLAEEKPYLYLPENIRKMPNWHQLPFGDTPTILVDQYNREHNPAEFTKVLRTYGLQVWIVEVKSNRIVAYREFPAAHLEEQYDQHHTADEVRLGALVTWIESLEKLEEKPTPFFEAVNRGDLPAVEHYIPNGADVNTKNKDSGGTALIAASAQGHRDVVNLLLDKGADVNARDKNGVTALIPTSENGHKEVVLLLLAKGADVNAKTNKGSTALFLASQNGYKEVVKTLLAKGADVNAKTNNGATALMVASGLGHKEIVQALLDMGADVNAKTNKESTALMFASQKGHKEICELLIRAGAK